MMDVQNITDINNNFFFLQYLPILTFNIYVQVQMQVQIFKVKNSTKFIYFNYLYDTVFLRKIFPFWKSINYEACHVHNIICDIIKRQANEKSKETSNRHHQILKVEYENFFRSFHVKFFGIYSQNSTVCIQPCINCL